MGELMCHPMIWWLRRKFRIEKIKFQVDEIILHPEFGAMDLNNDIAIVRLSTNATFNKYVRPVCLWKSNQLEQTHVIGKHGLVIGWGRTETGQTSNELRQASMPVISWGACLESNHGGRYLTERSFCAGARNGLFDSKQECVTLNSLVWLSGTSICSGDSGGSMTFEENGIYYIRGIVSAIPFIFNTTTQKTVCNSKEYAIFTDVAQYLPWIREMTAITQCETVVRCDWR